MIRASLAVVKYISFIFIFFSLLVDNFKNSFLNPFQTLFFFALGGEQYGDTTHTFVELNGYKGTFLPGYEPADTGFVDNGPEVGLQLMDHVVSNHEDGKMIEVCEW